MKKKLSQNERILKHLKKGGSLTPWRAWCLYASFRLGARIYDLRQEGYDITTEMITTPTGKHVALYSMPGYALTKRGK